MKRSILTIGLLGLAVAIPASALELTFTDRGGWEAIVTDLSNIDSGFQTIGTSSNFGSGGLLFTNLQIQGFNNLLSPPTTGYSLTRVNAGAGQNYYNWGSGAILRTDDKTALNTVFARLTFPNPVSAFGFNFGVGGCPTYFNGCYPGAASSVTIAPNGTPINPITTVQQPILGFWGVASDSQTYSFVDIVITESDRYLVLDDIAQGNYSIAPPPPPTETPEPGTFLQIAMGAGLLALARHRFASETYTAN